MKILILGGTGAMGRHLVHMLADTGNEVCVTTRTRSGLENNVQYIQGNAHNQDFLRGLLNHRWDAIIDFMVYSTAEFQERYEQFLVATKQYMFFSSSRVYADSAGPIKECSPRLLDVVEDNEYLKTDEYALAKARQENILFASNRKNWTIIRPYITYDDERLQLGVLEKEDWLYRALQGRSIVTAREIQNKRTTLTSGVDVSRAVSALIGREGALGEAFHITCNRDISWQEATDIYLETLARQGFRVKIKQQELEDFLAWRAGRYQVIYDRLFDRIFDNSKVDQFIDSADFVAPQDGLQQCLENFLSSDPYAFKLPNWREEALKDHVMNERAHLTEIRGVKQKIKYNLFRTMPKAGRLLIR